MTLKRFQTVSSLVRVLLIPLFAAAAFLLSPAAAQDGPSQITVPMSVGFNFVTVTEDTTIADATADIAGTFDIVFAFKNRAGNFLSYVGPAHPILNDPFPIHPGDGLMFQMNTPATWVQPLPEDDIVLARADLGDVVEGWTQTEDSGSVSADNYIDSFQSGEVVRDRGYVAGVQRNFEDPDFDQEVDTGLFMTVTVVTEWTDGDAAGLDFDLVLRFVRDFGQTAEDVSYEQTEPDDLGDQGRIYEFRVGDSVGVGSAFTVGRYLADTAILAIDPSPASIADMRANVEAWAREMEERLGALDDTGRAPLTLSQAGLGSLVEGWATTLGSGPVTAEEWGAGVETGAEVEARGFLAGFGRFFEDLDFVAGVGIGPGPAGTDVSEWTDADAAAVELGAFLSGLETFANEDPSFSFISIPTDAFGDAGVFVATDRFFPETGGVRSSAGFKFTVGRFSASALLFSDNPSDADIATMFDNIEVWATELEGRLRALD